MRDCISSVPFLLYSPLPSSPSVQDGSGGGCSGKEGWVQPPVRYLGRRHHCHRAGRAPTTNVWPPPNAVSQDRRQGEKWNFFTRESSPDGSNELCINSCQSREINSGGLVLCNILLTCHAFYSRTVTVNKQLRPFTVLWHSKQCFRALMLMSKSNFQPPRLKDKTKWWVGQSVFL